MDDIISDTQRDAWNDIQGSLGNKQRATLSVIASSPSTGYEVARILGCQSYRTLPRITELRKYGLVSDSGTRRLNPESGKNTIVWQACQPS